MISICIPVYNFDIAALYIELRQQTAQLSMPAEIIFIDDASEEKYRIINKQTVVDGTYIQLVHNVGRSKIRNLFLQHARYPYLLFLDCDSLIVKKDFLLSYLSQISHNKSYPVICGGRIYSDVKPERKYYLRWLYGTKRESRAAIERSKSANASFQSNNFLISIEVFSKVSFDERVTNYGHEDTLFGYELCKNNITIHHIDNPVLNGHLETNKQYLKQTEEGIYNVIQILKYVDYDVHFINDVTLLRIFYKIKKYKGLLSFLFFLSKPFVKKLLLSGFVSLRLFDWYKLGFLAQHINKTNSSQTVN